MSGVPSTLNLCFLNPRPAQPNPHKHTKRHTNALSLRENVTADESTLKTAAASEDAEVLRRAGEQHLLTATHYCHCYSLLTPSSRLSVSPCCV